MNLRALRLLARLARGAGAGPGGRPGPVGGIACDWYEPAAGRPRAQVIALHGVTLLGKDDLRLRAFARTLARGGALCAVPTLPGLADARWEPGDVDALGRVIEAVSAGGRVVLVGFSHGGSVALLAAARPAWAPRVAHVLAFGAYASLARTLDRIRLAPEPVRARDRDDLVYAHLLQVHRWGAALGLDPALRASAEDLLRRYCDRAPDEEKERFYDRHLRALDLLRRPEAQPEPATVAGLSPEGQLGGLACTVGLIHDPDDLLVPVEEAHALFRELATTDRAQRHRLLVTRVVQHVTPSGALRLDHVVRLVSMLAPLVGS